MMGNKKRRKKEQDEYRRAEKDLERARALAATGYGTIRRSTLTSGGRSTLTSGGGTGGSIGSGTISSGAITAANQLGVTSQPMSFRLAGGGTNYTWATSNGIHISSSPDYPPAPELPVEDQTEVFHGTKEAYLSWYPRVGVRLCPLNTEFGFYETDDRAHCRGRTCRDEEVPNLECRCGFYSYMDDAPEVASLTPTRGQVVLEVDLFGRVIVHEYGYRAARQRVRQLRAKGSCEFCGEPAGQLVIVNGYAASASNEMPFSGTPVPLIARCPDHTPQWDVPMTVEQLERTLKTEVVLT